MFLQIPHLEKLLDSWSLADSLMYFTQHKWWISYSMSSGQKIFLIVQRWLYRSVLGIAKGEHYRKPRKYLCVCLCWKIHIYQGNLTKYNLIFKKHIIELQLHKVKSTPIIYVSLWHRVCLSCVCNRNGQWILQTSTIAWGHAHWWWRLPIKFSSQKGDILWTRISRLKLSFW